MSKMASDWLAAQLPANDKQFLKNAPDHVNSNLIHMKDKIGITFLICL